MRPISISRRLSRPSPTLSQISHDWSCVGTRRMRCSRHRRLAMMCSLNVMKRRTKLGRLWMIRNRSSSIEWMPSLTFSKKTGKYNTNKLQAPCMKYIVQATCHGSPRTCPVNHPCLIATVASILTEGLLKMGQWSQPRLFLEAARWVVEQPADLSQLAQLAIADVLSC